MIEYGLMDVLTLDIMVLSRRIEFTGTGHAGAIVQAKRMGKYLVVGVHSDEEITVNKGPPVMSLEERYQFLPCLLRQMCFG
jgi:cytidyltransferase-like protein